MASVIDEKIHFPIKRLPFMAKQLIVFFFIFLFLYKPGRAQSISADQFGTVPDSLFSKARYPADPDVPFIYSLKKLHISFEEQNNSIIAVLHYHVRVKIFDSSVKQAAIVGIPYYFKNNIEHISGIRGFTYQSLEDKIPLDTKKVKTININSRYNVKEFTMPAVKDGSVIEYAYTIRRRYIEELPDFYLANQVPTKRAEVSITYPKYLRYKGITQNFSGQLHHFTTRVDTSRAPKVFSYPQPPPIIEETWRAENIPAVASEPYISTLDDYRGKVKFQLSEFGIPRQPLENSWKYVVADIRRKQHITERIAANDHARALGKQIAAGLSDPKAIQDSIFQFVSKTVNFSGSKTPFSSVGDDSVLQGEPADQAAINQTLSAMLQGAGIKAYPVLISTRKSGQINRSFPSFFQFNGQLVYSEINGQSYFMDASYPYSRPNLIPVDMYNQTGLLLKPNSYRWVDVNPAESVFSVKVDIEANLDRQGNLQGTLHAVNRGYPARQIREQYAQGTAANQIIKKALLEVYGKASIRNAELKNAQSDSLSTELSANFGIENYAASFTDGLEFRPMIVGYLQQNPFKSDKTRNLPVTLDAPEHLNLNFVIHLPAGMSIAQKPKDRLIQLPGAKFYEQYDMDSHSLRYSFKIDISHKQFSPSVFPRLLDLYNQWVDLSNRKWHLGR